MAAILYRYSVFKGLTMAQGAFAMTYPDEAGISAYAPRGPCAGRMPKSSSTARSWTARFISTRRGSATRAQVAAILMRYVQNVLSNR